MVLLGRRQLTLSIHISVTMESGFLNPDPSMIIGESAHMHFEDGLPLNGSVWIELHLSQGGISRGTILSPINNDSAPSTK